jgi:hypothetical protein
MTGLAKTKIVAPYTGGGRKEYKKSGALFFL